MDVLFLDMVYIGWLQYTELEVAL